MTTLLSALSGKKLGVAVAVLGLAIAFQVNAQGFSNNLGVLNENIEVGKTLTVGLNPSTTGSWTAYNSSPFLEVSTNADSVSLKGKKAGQGEIYVCETRLNNCWQIKVIVSGVGEVLGTTTSSLLMADVLASANSVGSWVNSNGTIYYVHTQGLIPVPTMKIFTSNGGKLSAVKQASAYDLQLPLLPLMELKDSRVR